MNMNVLLKKNKVTELMKNHDKSVTFNKPKKTSKSSQMWEYFSIVMINNVEQELVCCDKCKCLLVYRQKDGTTSLAKHQRSCQGIVTISNNGSTDQTKVTEYYSSSKPSDIPKTLKEKVKMACTEFTALDSRAFEIVTGDGFLKMAQSIFDAGRYFSISSNVNVEQLIPSSITVNAKCLLKQTNIIFHLFFY